MNCKLFDKEIIVQEAEHLALSRDIITQIAGEVDFFHSLGQDELFAKIREDFFNVGSLLTAPEMPQILQEIPRRETLFLLLALSLIGQVRKRFQGKGLDPELLEEGLADIRIWCLDHLKDHGSIGLGWVHGLHWIFMRIFTGQVLRFGRLECNRSFSFPDVIVLKNRRNGKIQALCNRDMALDKYGFITADETQTVRFSAKAERVFSGLEALPIREDGSVAESRTLFDPEEWEGFLLPGDNVLALHIPADGRLDVEECRTSLRRMKEFHNANSYPFKAFICSSWFLDPSLDGFAGENSNMVQFRKLGTVLGPGAPSCDVIYRVFGSGGIHDAKGPLSSLQQKLAEHFASGGIFRGGRIVIDPQTL